MQPTTCTDEDYIRRFLKEKQKSTFILSVRRNLPKIKLFSVLSLLKHFLFMAYLYFIYIYIHIYSEKSKWIIR